MLANCVASRAAELRVILQELGTLKATFNSPCELFRGHQERKPGCCTKVGEGVLKVKVLYSC